MPLSSEHSRPAPHHIMNPSAQSVHPLGRHSRKASNPFPYFDLSDLPEDPHPAVLILHISGTLYACPGQTRQSQPVPAPRKPHTGNQILTRAIRKPFHPIHPMCWTTGPQSAATHRNSPDIHVKFLKCQQAGAAKRGLHRTFPTMPLTVHILRYENISLLLFHPTLLPYRT